MGRRTFGEVRDELWDIRGGPEWVVGPVARFERGWGPLWRTGTGRGTLGDVQDGSKDPREGTIQVGDHLGRSGMDRGI